jgi:hypothetical protein
MGNAIRHHPWAFIVSLLCFIVELVLAVLWYRGSTGTDQYEPALVIFGLVTVISFASFGIPSWPELFGGKKDGKPDLNQLQSKDLERRREALREVLGDIAPAILTILNVAPHTVDRQELAQNMRSLHKRFERMRPLFQGNTRIQSALTCLGNLGGTVISPYAPVGTAIFEIYREEVSILERELEQLNSSLS